jgi:hypothetical protein
MTKKIKTGITKAKQEKENKKTEKALNRKVNRLTKIIGNYYA